MAGRPNGTGGKAEEVTADEIKRSDKCLKNTRHEHRALLCFGLGSGGTFGAPLVTRTVREDALCCWTPEGGIPPPVTLGTAGGEVTSGAVLLSVPSGALSSDVEIAIVAIGVNELSGSLPKRTSAAMRRRCSRLAAARWPIKSGCGLQDG
ncbi:MAG: hypothetical protein A2289_21730 [Deltaproteobacteria bacterium RIFOXYA12_FULL_58_15]|nr:MAG: hypothetical protein A2289_21730 [Deltaproteobacteria bacterium RIFOXYA12_FULL_58_15]OGR09534.1 MAG: hypothetical protein A2341_16605 [Deltaproteobacteria bacterium RIFOXYB12_FULL_58_9]